MSATLTALLRACQNESVGKYLFANACKHSKWNNSSNIAIEFSSPNIAKPFHIGHLRSTLIGNSLCNMFDHCSLNPRRLNWVGDWGKQFGLLAAGFEMIGNEDKLNNDGVRHLLDVYVWANKQAEIDLLFSEKANRIFHEMQYNSKSLGFKLWKRATEISMNNFSNLYKKLGVHFDVINFESQYTERAIEMIKRWDKWLVTRHDGVRGLAVAENSRFIPLVKSDGTLLYLTRDLACFLDRIDQGLDKVIYVVGKEQTSHFDNMKACLKIVGCSNLTDALLHVPFRNVKHMSTRKGQMTLIDDVLNEGKEHALNYARRSPFSRLTPQIESEIAEKMAIGGLIIHELKRPRLSAYKFSWEEALKQRGDSATFLQFLHARLCSIEMKANVNGIYFNSDSVFDQSYPSNSQDVGIFNKLCMELEMVDLKLIPAVEKMNPDLVFKAVYDLCSVINQAKAKLRVVGENDLKLAQKHLGLFYISRNVLASFMRTLGVEPIDQI